MVADINEQGTDGSPEPRVATAPITNRFLYVDIAALRAKQLRRGAVPRLDGTPDPIVHREPPHKPERVAMEEVRRGLVSYDLPPLKPVTAERDR